MEIKIWLDILSKITEANENVPFNRSSPRANCLNALTHRIRFLGDSDGMYFEVRAGCN